MRLIDADAFEIELQHEWENNNISNGEWMDIRQWLKEAPTIDAEPVVRCCDCKYLQCNMRQDGILPFGVDEYECRHWCGSCDPTDFCSYGERREE